MIRKNPVHDLVSPPGQVKNEVLWPFPASSPRLANKPDFRISDIIEGVVRRSSEPPVKSNKEVFDEGYAQGWLDCQASQRKWQEENKG